MEDSIGPDGLQHEPEPRDCGDPDGLAYALEVARGQKSDRLSKRSAAETIWRAIADGQAADSTKITWVEYVAGRLVKDLINNHDLDERFRGTTALSASSLWGVGDEYAELVSWIEMLADMRELANLNPKPTPKHVLPHMKKLGFNWEEGEKRKAEKVAARQINKAMAIREGRRKKPAR